MFFRSSCSKSGKPTNEQTLNKTGLSLTQLSPHMNYSHPHFLDVFLPAVWPDLQTIPQDKNYIYFCVTINSQFNLRKVKQWNSVHFKFVILYVCCLSECVDFPGEYGQIVYTDFCLFSLTRNTRCKVLFASHFVQ